MRDLLRKKHEKEQKKLSEQELELMKREREIESLERKSENRKAFDTAVIAAFTFVAGLFWRDVADDLITLLLPQWDGLIGSLFTAVIVTAIIIFIVARRSYKLRKLEDKIKFLKEELDKKKVNSNFSDRKVVLGESVDTSSDN